MAGYKGFSMSNNAVAAYESGEKPISKWTKREILSMIKSLMNENECNFLYDEIKKMPLNLMKKELLIRTSWHHTSNHYNETDFYSLDEDYILELTDEDIKNKIKDNKEFNKIVKEKNEKEEQWKCTFLEWSGTRRHPKATEITEIGVVKGIWFYRKNGSKKKTTANGFKFIEKL